MKAVTKIMAGGVVAAALFAAAPAAAQYYPSPYGYGSNGNVVGQVLNQVLGGGYGYNNNYSYGANSQAVVNQCVNAVQSRLNRNYSYGYNGNYGYGAYGAQPYGYGQARVLGISRVEPRSRGGVNVRGVATSGQGYGYAYGGQQSPNLTFKCSTDYRGYVTDIDIDAAGSSYGGYQPYQPYQSNDPYAAYGYRRY